MEREIDLVHTLCGKNSQLFYFEQVRCRVILHNNWEQESDHFMKYFLDFLLKRK